MNAGTEAVERPCLDPVPVLISCDWGDLAEMQGGAAGV